MLKMKITINRFRIYFFGFAVFIAMLPEVLATNNFVPIRLPHGVQIELPRNWTVLSENKLVTIDSAVQSRMELNQSLDVSHNLNFGASHYNDEGNVDALINVRYYPKLEVSQADVRAAGQSDIRELDSVIRQEIFKAGQVSGFSVLNWNGTNIQVVNGIAVFITEYKRSPIKENGNVKVRLVRVLNGSQSFTITISYHEDQEYLLRPICDRIISTLRN